MPGLTQKNCQFTNDNALCANGFWSKQRDEISFNHLQKFWSELSPQAREDLLKIDKQTILEQARKNMYCSRCNGLLLEGFTQIVMYGKSSQPNGTGRFLFGRRYGGLKNQNDAVSNLDNGCHGESQDPAAHPWGGLTTAKDGTLTVLSTYINSKSLKGLQNVFDSARARERERELLYPDACGGGGRGWMSQGMPSYGRVHGTRETCALHTARLSCDTLVDFWSALGEETRHSLLRMKEEDFIGRLMFRFDSKRFCRDCRKNVIREFKELKELKRMRREPHCTHTFCAADSIFQYEVSDDAVRADWHQTFMDSSGTYHHFEWAVGTGEGKSDILEFENVGMNKFVNVDGLDLGGLSACYITLRAWKQDGRCTELSVKAHALKGQECVHSRLIVGDGFVSITRGESIRRFFEHAEEAEEEEDDDVMDKDGNELDGECSRPQKHAKSPELAREFLLDAATVIFKEQVEKAFREGTARQNAHIIFVCLVLKLLEERVHVACKEIITLEKQTKLLEEEEKEKQEEEERSERRRMKEREKKQRRKERLKGKDGKKDKESTSSNSVSVQDQVLKDEQSSIDDEENITVNGSGSSTELITGRPPSPNMQDDITEVSSDWYSSSESRDHYHCVVADSGDYTPAQDECDYTTSEHSEYSVHGDKFWKDDSSDSVSKWSDRRRSAQVTGNVHSVSKSDSRMHTNNFESYSRSTKGLSRQFRVNGAKAQPINCPIKHGTEKLHSSNSRMGERYNSFCSCNYITDYKVNGGSKVTTSRSGWEESDELKSDSTSGKVKQFNNGAKTYQSHCMRDSSGRSHKHSFGNNRSRDLLHTKMVWEPLDSQKNYPRRNSESDIAMLSSTLNVEGTQTSKVQSRSITRCGEDAVAHSSKTPSVKNLSVCDSNKDKENGNFISETKNSNHSGELLVNEVDLSLKVSSLNNYCDAVVGSDSNSENSYSNLSEGDSNLTSSNTQNLETTNSSDSEDASQQSDNKETSLCQGSEFPGCRDTGMEKTPVLKLTETCKNDIPSSIPFEIGRFNVNHQVNSPTKSTMTEEHIASSCLSSESQVGLPPAPNQNLPFPMFHQPLSSIGYYHPNTIIWPTASANGFIAMPQLNPYVVSSPVNYGWNSNPGFCVPYGGVSHLEPPLLNQGHVPIYHPVSKANETHPEEQSKISKPILAQEISFQGHNKQAPNGRTVQKPDPQKAHVGKEEINNGFSLFHFGGPVALSSTLKEGKIEALALNNSVAHGAAEVDHVCSKKEASVEEYSLFASSNGFKFSF